MTDTITLTLTKNELLAIKEGMFVGKDYTEETSFKIDEALEKFSTYSIGDEVWFWNMPDGTGNVPNIMRGKIKKINKKTYQVEYYIQNELMQKRVIKSNVIEKV